MNSIPKQAFFYWGTEVLPWVRFLTLKTFRQHHPDWVIYLYLKPVLDKVEGFEQKNYLDSKELVDLNLITFYIDIEKELGVEFPVKNFITIYADIFRYVILDKFGGFYCDMDCLFFKSLETLGIDDINYDTFILPRPYHHFLLSKPQSLYIKKTLEEQLDHIDEFSTNFLITTSCTTNVNITDEDKVWMLPLHTTEENIGSDGPYYSDSICLNWHGSGWHKRYETITENNYKELDHPLAAAIRYCLHRNTGKPTSLGNFLWIDRGED